MNVLLLTVGFVCSGRKEGRQEGQEVVNFADGASTLVNVNVYIYVYFFINLVSKRLASINKKKLY